MCCLVTALAFLGPRAAIIFWWLFDPGRWDKAFDTWLWPVLGFVFLPFTTLMYVAVGLGGLRGFDWVWMAFAVLIDVAMYTGGGYGNRDRSPWGTTATTS